MNVLLLNFTQLIFLLLQAPAYLTQCSTNAINIYTDVLYYLHIKILYIIMYIYYIVHIFIMYRYMVSI